MKRFYYLTDSLSSVRNITQDLPGAGIGANRLHFMAASNGNLDEAHVPTTSPWEETEIMPFGFRGVFVGLLLGALFGLVLIDATQWAQAFAWQTVVASAFMFAGFGGWLGGVLGLSLPNHHLKPYMNQLHDGQYLVMVETDDEAQEDRLVDVMDHQHREARLAGRENHYSPLL